MRDNHTEPREGSRGHLSVGARWWAVDADAAGQALAGYPPTDNENRGATSHQRVAIGGTADATDCTGEYIQLSGTVHFVDQIFETDGGYHLHTHYNLAQGRGEGLDPQTLEPTGTEYTITSAGGTMENFVRTGDIVTGHVDSGVVIGKGQAADQVGILQFHYISVFVDGEWTTRMDTENIFLKCQPGNVTPPPDTASPAATANATAQASPTAKESPGTDGAPLAMGAGVLLVGAGLAARRLF